MQINSTSIKFNSAVWDACPLGANRTRKQPQYVIEDQQHLLEGLTKCQGLKVLSTEALRHYYMGTL